MRGYMVLHTNGCVVAVSDDAVRVENAVVGCLVSPKKAVCNVWAPTKDNRLRLQVLRLENIPNVGEVETFAITQNGYTLQLSRWSTGSHALEVWHDNRRISTIEWRKENESAQAYFQGDANGFIRFAEASV